MRSIHHHHHHHTPPLSTLSKWSSRHTPPPTGVLRRHFPNHVRTKPMAVTSSHLVVLTVNSPAAAGDISILIPTSVAFIFLYWIANFVVPGIIMKDLQADDANKDQNANDQNLN
ncbi:hypothetical protein HanXRQr2_Chr05g0233861 [Helianthus annuus]|uniref:Uncharacterized protein n=1 Tax=Helianthus annuus TaxID=4232 RepID=A0A251UTZ9_HELAN|nr:uncharacterized protein LOC110942085 [Helianthus annuus]KAF5807450.1 hypothetical protein HanXRQr2_Chr05g0233861 [Helianthus annuus]KAJ0571542.1 hypothetical protein HanHA300_Chr05g0191351 [Helianthus annuus]KAJ0585945.1 hypothetical protein HanHA89_Chr05g0206461 [Helianthus annuus]KAJ0748415.1 hypothetical protein HanOQP8_Chr05g0200951 [Helianthus annuus]